MSSKQKAEIRTHMSEGEASMFGRALDTAEVYLEFGAGGSTIEAIGRAHLRSYSVEADKGWLATLQCRADVQSAVAEGRLTFTHGDIGPVGAWSFPLSRAEMHPWDNYCLAVWRQMSEAPDLVLVDGRFRLACCIISFLACPADTTILLHDFGRHGQNRQNYALAVDLGEVVDTCDTLIMLKRPAHFDYLRAVSVLEVARKDIW